MAAKVSQLLQGGLRYGVDLKTSAASIEPGMLVTLDTSGSTVSTSGSTAATKPFGMAFGNRYKPYAPTTRVFDSGEPLTVIQGQGQVALSADFFDEGSLPAADVDIYGAVGGKWTISAGIGGTAPKVGHSLGTRVRHEAVGGTGAAQNLAVIWFDFSP